MKKRDTLFNERQASPKQATAVRSGKMQASRVLKVEAGKADTARESTQGAAVRIVRVEQADDALIEAFKRLLPQLSRSAPALTRADLQAIVSAPGNDVYVAITPSDQRIVGTLSLVHFRIPSGVRAWIEDVVVDSDARGLGVGAALTHAAIARSQELRAKSLDLTSNPGRQAAHRLYESCGFALRDTRVYRYRG